MKTTFVEESKTGDDPLEIKKEDLIAEGKEKYPDYEADLKVGEPGDEGFIINEEVGVLEYVLINSNGHREILFTKL